RSKPRSFHALPPCATSSSSHAGDLGLMPTVKTITFPIVRRSTGYSPSSTLVSPTSGHAGSRGAYRSPSLPVGKNFLPTHLVLRNRQHRTTGKSLRSSSARLGWPPPPNRSRRRRRRPSRRQVTPRSSRNG